MQQRSINIRSLFFVFFISMHLPVQTHNNTASQRSFPFKRFVEDWAAPLTLSAATLGYCWYKPQAACECYEFIQKVPKVITCFTSTWCIYYGIISLAKIDKKIKIRKANAPSQPCYECLEPLIKVAVEQKFKNLILQIRNVHALHLKTASSLSNVENKIQAMAHIINQTQTNNDTLLVLKHSINQMNARLKIIEQDVQKLTSLNELYKEVTEKFYYEEALKENF